MEGYETECKAPRESRTYPGQPLLAFVHDRMMLPLPLCLRVRAAHTRTDRFIRRVRKIASWYASFVLFAHTLRTTLTHLFTRNKS